MEVSDQLHAPEALFPGTYVYNPSLSWHMTSDLQRMMGLQRHHWSWCMQHRWL